MKPLFGLLHPVHVPRSTDKQQPREDFLDEGPDLRKSQPRSGAGPHPFGLQEGIGDRADHQVMLPPRIAPPFEVVEAELRLEILVVLFDGPPVVRQPHHLRERRRGGQRDEVVFAAASGPEPALAEQPHLGGEPALPPVGGRCDPDRREVGGPGQIGAIAPFDAPPRARRQPVAQAGDADRLLIGPAVAAVAGRRLLAIAGAASACRETPSDSGRCPPHRAGATGAGLVEPCGCLRIRRRPRPPSASRRPPGCAAAASEPAATFLGTVTRAGSPAAAQRGGSRVHTSGTYSKAPMGHARWSAQSAAVTATWQLATLPSAPQYLARDGHGMAPGLREARLVQDQNARAGRDAPRRSRRHTTSASHGACVMKCWNAW